MSQNLTRMQTLLGSYESNFVKALTVEEERGKSIERGMNPIGAKARTNLMEIVRSAMSEHDYQAAARAGIAQEALMTARVSALRFIATTEKAQIEAFARGIQTLNQAMAELQERLTNDDQQAFAADVITLAGDYVSAFGKVVATTTEDSQSGQGHHG